MTALVVGTRAKTTDAGCEDVTALTSWAGRVTQAKDEREHWDSFWGIG